MSDGALFAIQRPLQESVAPKAHVPAEADVGNSLAARLGQHPAGRHAEKLAGGLGVDEPGRARFSLCGRVGGHMVTIATDRPRLLALQPVVELVAQITIAAKAVDDRGLLVLGKEVPG